MPTLQLTNEQLTGSLFSYWDGNFPLSITTIYPGMKVNTAVLDEWLEFWVDNWSRRTYRSTATQLTDLSITVHCFVKQGLDKSRIHELADAAQSTLAHSTVPVRNFDLSSNPLLGYANLFETESHDLTRNDLNSQRHAMQHVVVTCSGIAQSL